METQIEKTEKIEVQPSGYFENAGAFDHVQRVAIVFSKSDLVPKRYQGNVGNCIIALEMAARIGASPLMVMQNLDIILGKPCWSSKFLIASMNACGRFSPLRYEEDEQLGGRTRAWAYDKGQNEKIFGAWVSMEMAKLEGWIDKNGSKWKTMPELMRRYRAATFFVNQFAPEISMGLQTVEEVYDIAPAIQIAASSVNKEMERLELMLADCKTPEEVKALQEQFPDEDVAVFNSRIEAINDEDIKKMSGKKGGKAA